MASKRSPLRNRIELGAYLALRRTGLGVAPGRYRLVYSEPLDVTTPPAQERGVEKLTALVTVLVESQVRAEPEQWLWLHDRWRS